MGKRKQAQRTKNNARPSNSSRSAEILGTAAPNFVGFSAVKNGGYVPVLPGLSLCSLNEVEMNNVDSNFQVILKKMNKKDATTKYKALQEFATLCQSAELATVEGMLPFWPRLYCALSIDIDHRVREAAQSAHAAVVKRIGKGIAMYLKQLAGAWFTSQYDTYAPAASAAVNSFNNTFPPWKIVDAIIHCQREILLYINDNINIQTAQTLSSQKSLTSEEMDTIYQRVLVTNLQGYSCYFKKVPLCEIDKTLEIHNKILNSAKFWKLAKHDVLSIKAAFFNVLTSVMENAEKLLQNEKKKTVTTIMNSLDESDPGILSAVWESALIVITKFDDWHLVASVDKLVLPKLWRVLRSGGQCCANIVYPNLLPLVSQFSKLSIDNLNANELYMNFFDNMRQGFSAKSVQMSRSETLAVVASFVECLRYSILVNAGNIDLCIRLLNEQLMPVLEACMTENIFMKQPCFSEITDLVRYWSRNRVNEEYKSYVPLMRQFWIELRSLFDKLINTPPEIAASRTVDARNAQIEFLLTLKNVPDCIHKKLKVKFSVPNDSVANEPKVKADRIRFDTDTIFNAELCQFVNEICIIYFDKTHDDQGSVEHIEQLNRFMKYFASKELVVALSKSKSKFNEDFFEFYDKSLKPLLSKETTEQVIKLIFNFIAYISDTEKDRVLKSLLESNNIAITKNVIHCSLSCQSNRKDRVLKKQCAQAGVTGVLIDAAKEIVSFALESDLEKINQDLILLAFETSEDKDLLIGEEGAYEIASILCDSLNETNETKACSTQFIAFVTKFMILTWNHKQTVSSAVQILETLFELCTRGHDDSTLAAAASSARNSWKEGLATSSRILSHSEFNDLINRCAVIIWSKIYNARSAPVKDVLTDLATDVLDVIINNNDNAKCDRVGETVLLFLTASDIKLWVAEAATVAIYAETITGNLFLSYVENPMWVFQDFACIDITNETISDSTATCLSWALFTTNLLDNLLVKGMKDCDSDDEDVNASSSGENVESYGLNLPGITEILINVIYVTTVAEIYSIHFKSTKYYNEVNNRVALLKNSFINLQKHLAKNIHDEISSHLQMNRVNYGYMISYLIRTYYVEFQSKENRDKYYKSVMEREHNEEADDRMPGSIPLTDDDIYTLRITRNAIRFDVLGGDSFAFPRSVMEKIMSYHKEDFASFLLDRDVSNVSWNRLLLPLEIIRLLTALVQEKPSKLTREHWDFILISLAMWQQSVDKSKHNYTDVKVTALITAVCQLYYQLQILMNKHEQEPIPELPAALSDEWKNVFAGDLYSNIVRTWMFCANSHDREDTGTVIKSTVPLDYLGKAISALDKNILFKKHDKDSEVIDFNEILTLSLKLLPSSVPSIQLGAYHTLKHMVTELVQRDKILIESDNFEPSGLYIRKFEEMLLNTQNIVNTMLVEFKLCDIISCTIQPFTDSYTYTLGYLLLWAIVLDMCTNAHSDLRYRYAEILKDDLFPCLLNNIFKLMPVEVLQDNKNKAVKLLEIFTTVPSFNFGESWTEWRLDHIVCWLYTDCLRHLPVLVRQWWSTSDSRVSATIDKITRCYVSPMLCQEELLNNKLVNLENMQVKVHPTAREVVAFYQMDDTKIELSIVLPPNHPLGTVIVESGHVGGANWRNCHMQLSIFLTHQNGSVWDGLLTWKRILDKKYAGVEECCICFSIFHITSQDIPKLSCHACRKKFHTPCLYKWFNTSQKSTCPICRNIF